MSVEPVIELLHKGFDRIGETRVAYFHSGIGRAFRIHTKATDQAEHAFVDHGGRPFALAPPAEMTLARWMAAREQTNAPCRQSHPEPMRSRASRPPRQPARMTQGARAQHGSAAPTRSSTLRPIKLAWRRTRRSAFQVGGINPAAVDVVPSDNRCSC